MSPIKLIYSLAFLSISILASGCSQRINGETDSSFQDSVQKITSKMNPGEKRIFEQNMALASKTLQKLNGDAKVAAMLNGGAMIDILRQDLDGMTQSEVEAIANKKRSEIRVAAENEIKRLQANISEKIKAKEELALEISKIQFEIKEPTVVAADSEYDSDYWAFPVRIKNNSKLTFSTVRLNIDEKSPTSSTYTESTPEHPITPNSSADLLFKVYYKGNSAKYPPSLITPDADVPRPVLITSDPAITIIEGHEPGSYTRDQSRAIENLREQERATTDRLTSMMSN
jgi:hypothetical protein